MTTQASLFEVTAADVAAERVGRTHGDDPVTSRAAASGVRRLAGQRLAVFVALARAGERGLTPHEACELTPCTYPHVCATRMAELRDLELCERTSDTRPTPAGASAHVWVLTEEGVRVARERQP